MPKLWTERLERVTEASNPGLLIDTIRVAMQSSERGQVAVSDWATEHMRTERAARVFSNTPVTERGRAAAGTGYQHQHRHASRGPLGDQGVALVMARDEVLLPNRLGGCGGLCYTSDNIRATEVDAGGGENGEQGAGGADGGGA